MAFAPASMVRRILSPVLPPVAMMGTSGRALRASRTSSGVCAAAAMFRMEAPASMRASKSVPNFVTVMTVGISITPETARRFRLLIGALSTTPIAPCDSTSRASCTVRRPRVVPPPTPQNTGT